MSTQVYLKVRKGSKGIFKFKIKLSVFYLSAGAYIVINVTTFIRNLRRRNQFYEKVILAWSALKFLKIQFHIPMNDRLFGIKEILSQDSSSNQKYTFCPFITFYHVRLELRRPHLPDL